MNGSYIFRLLLQPNPQYLQHLLLNHHIEGGKRFVTTSEKKLFRVSDISLLSETVYSFSARVILSRLIPLSVKHGLIAFQNVLLSTIFSWSRFKL